MAVVTLSSKGQLALPLSVRKKFKMARGEKLVLLEDDGSIVLRQVSRLEQGLDEEVFSMVRAARAWAEIAKGRSKRVSKAAFLAELSKW